MTTEEREELRAKVALKIVQRGAHTSFGAFLYMVMNAGFVKTLLYKIGLLFRTRQGRLELARNNIKRDAMVELLAERPEAMVAVHLSLLAQFVFMAGSRLETQSEAYTVLDSITRRARWLRACRGKDTEVLDLVLSLGKETEPQT